MQVCLFLVFIVLLLTMQGFECTYISSQFIHPFSQHVFVWYMFRLSRFCLLFSLGVVTIYNWFNLCISSIKIFNQLNCYLSFISSPCKFFFSVCVFFVILFLADILCQNIELICVCPPKRFVSSAKDGMSTQTFFSFLRGGEGLPPPPPPNVLCLHPIFCWVRFPCSFLLLSCKLYFDTGDTCTQSSVCWNVSKSGFCQVICTAQLVITLRMAL